MTAFAALAAAGLLLGGGRARAAQADPSVRERREAEVRERNKIGSSLLHWYEGLSAEKRSAFLDEHPDLEESLAGAPKPGAAERRAALSMRLTDWLKKLSEDERGEAYQAEPGLKKAADAESAREETLRAEEDALREKIDGLVLRPWFDGLAADERTELLGKNDILKAVVEHRRAFAREADRPKVAATVFCQWYWSLDRPGLLGLYALHPSLKTQLGEYADEALRENPAAPTSTPSALPEEDSD